MTISDLVEADAICTWEYEEGKFREKRFPKLVLCLSD